MNNKVLIVEDEIIVAMQIENYLTELGLDVIAIANNYDDAYSLAIKNKPHIILMDIKIHGAIDGITTASMILKKINTSIVYLTAYCDELTIERAIKTNPTSYLVKPFNKNELLASMRMASYNYEKTKISSKKGDIILDDEFSYESQTKQLFCNEGYIHLTKRESQLLNLLIKAKNSIIDINDMENEIWPDKLPNENTRRALVSRLRAKMKYKFIETISGVGYKLNL